MVEGQRYSETLELVAQGRALYLIALIMGNYYGASGRNIEAMACYAAQVKECIRLSSDNGPLNDGMAFRRLGDVFAGLGDKNGAVTMWHQSYSLTKYDNESNGEDEELVEQSIICRGCHRSVKISNIWICRYSHNIIL
jgi:hypothetical protein